MAGPSSGAVPTVLTSFLGVAERVKENLGDYPENEAPLGLGAEVGALILAVGNSLSSSDSQTSLLIAGHLSHPAGALPSLAVSLWTDSTSRRLACWTKAWRSMEARMWSLGSG